MVRQTINRTATIEFIQTLLSEIASNVYHERVTQGAAFPYITFNVGPAFSGDDSEATFTLTVNLWDNKGNNIKNLEQSTDNIIEFLTSRICNTGDITLWFNQPFVLSLPDPDENIRRRQINLNVNYNNV